MANAAPLQPMLLESSNTFIVKVIISIRPANFHVKFTIYVLAIGLYRYKFDNPVLVSDAMNETTPAAPKGALYAVKHLTLYDPAARHITGIPVAGFHRGNAYPAFVGRAVVNEFAIAEIDADMADRGRAPESPNAAGCPLYQIRTW